MDGGEFRWLIDIGADDTVTGPSEAETAAALCRRFGPRALLSIAEPTDEWWCLIAADEDRYVLTGQTRP